MTTARYIDPIDSISQRERQQAEGFIDGVRNRIGLRWFSDSDRKRELDKELRAFADAQRYLSAVSWLARGLEVLAENGEAVDPTFVNKHGRKGRSDLEEEVETQISEAAEEGEDYAYSQEVIALTKAWLSQTDYEVYVRVRDFEEYLKELVLDDALAFAHGDGDDINRNAAERWAKIVDAWAEDIKAQRPDRLLHGKAI